MAGQQTQCFEDKPALIQCLPELNNLRIKGELTDLSIELQDNVTLHVHSVVLVSRVPTLLSSVCGVRKERKAVLQWPKVSSEIARPLIDYIYTGQLKVCEATAAGLVLLSKQLLLTHVEEWVVSFIAARLNSENIASNWNFAQILNNDHFTNACLQHIKTGFEATIASDFFIQLPSDTVLSLLRADDLQVGSEESVFEAIRLWVSPCGEIDELRVVHAAAMMKEVRWNRINPEFRYKLLDNDGFWNRNVECLRLLGRIAGWFECPSSRAGRECPFNTSRRITQEEICLVGTSASSGQSVLIRWFALPQLKEGRQYAAAVALPDGRVFVIGGQKSGSRLNSVETCHLREPADWQGQRNTSGDFWKNAASMASARSGHAAVAFRGSIFVAGGNTSSGTSAVEVFAPPDNQQPLGQWTQLTNSTLKWPNGALVVWEDRLFSFGSNNNSSVSMLEFVPPQSSSTPSRKDYASWIWSDRGKATTIFAADDDIQEDQLVIFLLLHPKLNIREDGVELFFERQHLIPFDDDESVIHIPSPEFRSVVSENQRLQPL
nr:unnamed protein product [Spirometra erinaceieuropaei]